MLAIPRSAELHLWFCRRERVDGSDAFLREVLSRYTDVAVALRRGIYGKPALAAPALPLEFNLSDSRDWRAIVISGVAAVGIDLEYCDPGREVLKLARRCFSPVELADLQGCTPQQRRDRFYDYWTLKEAHIKAAGGSLGRELETTWFELQYPAATSGAVGSIVPPPSATPAWYCLLQYQTEYRLALCSRAPLDFTPGLRLFELADGSPTIDCPLPLRAVSALPAMAPATACL